MVVWDLRVAGETGGPRNRHLVMLTARPVPKRTSGSIHLDVRSYKRGNVFDACAAERREEAAVDVETGDPRKASPANIDLVVTGVRLRGATPLEFGAGSRN